MIMTTRDKYNSSGCLDMTAYIALQRIEREEKAAIKAANAARKKKHPYIKGRNINNSGDKR